MTLIGVKLKEYGVDDIVIGLINSMFFAGAILSSITSSKIIPNLGHIRSFGAFAALLVLAFLSHSIYFNEILWGIMRFVSGFAFYSLIIIIESWINEKSSKEDRGKILAIYSIIFYLSIAIGQALLNIDESLRDSLFEIGSISVLASLIFVAMTRVKEPTLTPNDRYSFPKLITIAPLALMGSLVGGFLVGGFFSMMPIYITNISDSKEMLSVFMSLAIIGGLLTQWPVGYFSDRFGRRNTIFLVGAYIAIISTLFIILPQNTTTLYILSMLLGGGIFLIYPLSLARANDVIDEYTNVIEISRSLLFAYGIGSFLSPIIIGISSSFIGPLSIFGFFAIASAFIALYALTKEKIPPEELSVYVNVPSTYGHEIADLDPRQDEEWVEEHRAVSKDEEEASLDKK